MASASQQAARVIKAPFGRDVIETILPHRDPFLFVDEVLELELGVRIVARKLVRGDEAFFEGHFPGRPIMPGVIMVEALAQAAAILVLLTPENRDKLPLFAGIDKIRFKRIVSPGDELILTARPGAAWGQVGKGEVEARVGGKLAVRGTLMFATE